MRSVYDQPFEQDPCDLLLNRFRVRFGEKIKQSAAEVMRVNVRIPQLVGYSV